MLSYGGLSGLVRARGLKLDNTYINYIQIESGLVRARGLKHVNTFYHWANDVRARKSPWIETCIDYFSDSIKRQGS